MTRLIFYILSLGDPWCRVNLWVSFFLITTCTCTLFWNTVLFSNPGVMANFVVASWCRKWIRSGMAWWSLGWHGCDGYSLTRVFIRYYVWKKSKAKLKLCHQVYAFFPVFLLQGLIPGPPSYFTAFPNIYVAACGTQFYKQCFPSGSIHLGLCCFAIHWLSKIPCSVTGSLGHRQSQNPEERELFSKQAAADWETFLLMRAKELSPGTMWFAPAGTDERVEPWSSAQARALAGISALRSWAKHRSHSAFLLHPVIYVGAEKFKVARYSFFSGPYLNENFNWHFTNLHLLWSMWKLHQFLEKIEVWLNVFCEVIDISMETMN